MVAAPVLGNHEVLVSCVVSPGFHFSDFNFCVTGEERWLGGAAASGH